MWRFWDSKKCVFIAPAMNTLMYLSQITQDYLEILKTHENIHMIPPISKKLACGDIGIGGIADSEVIFNEVIKYI